MFKLRRNKNRGLTLIEMLLISGLVAVIIMAGIRFWNNQRINVETKQTVSMLMGVSDAVRNSLKFVNQDQFNSSTITNASLETVVRNYLEARYKTNTGFVTSLGTNFTVTYGGLLIPEPAANKNYGIIFQLTNLSPKECSKLVTSQLKQVFSQVRVNNAITLDLRGNMAATSIPALANACAANLTNNTVRFDMPLNEVFSSEDRIITQAEAYIRDRDSAAYIGNALNTNFSGSKTCSGGATWNAATEKCGCPANTRWMGVNKGCIPFNASGTNNLANAGVCNLNDGLSQTTNRCAVLNPSIGVASGIYNNGKILPTHSITNNATGTNKIAPVNVPVPTTITNTPIGATSEEIGGRTISSPAINAGGSLGNVCLYGTLTNNRCVPPATPPTGLW